MGIPTSIDPEKLPDHEVERFQNFYEVVIDGQPAFKLQDGSTFLLDSNNGWVDERNCYYNSLGEPAGWFRIFDGRTFFYNNEGYFVPYKKDPSSLPKHNEKVNITILDADYNFLEQNGCYYDKFGEPLGWKLKCEDDQLYFFDLNGDYIDINAGDEKNDLQEFDLGDFKQEFKQKAQFIKQSQKPYPKEEPKALIKAQNEQQQQQQNIKQQQRIQSTKRPNFSKSIPQPQKSIPQPQKSNHQPSTNQKGIYHYLLPDDQESKSLFVKMMKEKLNPKPEFTINALLLTVKCEQSNKELEQDFQLENGKCVKFKN